MTTTGTIKALFFVAAGVLAFAGPFEARALERNLLCPNAPETRCPPRKEGKVQKGLASWYGPRFHGRPTASGEPFDQNAMTAAHRTLPLGTAVLVTDPTTGRAVQVEINDRGPYVDGRIIDLSKGAASELGITDDGLRKVEVEVVHGPRPPTPAPEPDAQVAER